jgi:demethylmenaquinone methyltransferase/2-methoxy-6-polyprenyl-1,4-benzoquinol methylase/phosphoethanolamine N-methyltransferase
MHRLHNAPKAHSGPETKGSTIHRASEYDLFTSLFGFGANSRNSRTVIELAGVKAGDRVLDVACGTGNLTLAAQRYAGEAGRVWGIDASPEMIEVARKKAARSGLPLQFEVRLAEDLGFPESTFDVVISRLAFHHLPDDLKLRALDEIFRVLKPGGTLLIADFTRPTHSILTHLASMFVGPRMMQASTNGYADMLRAAGFVGVESGPTSSSFLAFVRGKKAQA